MRGNEFLDKLELVDPTYIEEADQPLQRKRTVWLQLGGLAACLCVAAAAAFTFHGAGRLPGPNPGGIAPGPGTSQAPSPAVADSPTVSVQPDVLRIDLGGIVVNDADEPVSAARLWYDPLFYEEVRWDSGDAADYFGRALAPAYVPEGLTPTNPEGSALAVLRREDGAVVYDTLALGYFRQFGTREDGSPRFLDENCVQHGFQLTASKLGQHGCCVYLGPEDTVEWSDIAGTPVAIGYRTMSHGPYDPDTHEPAGYYDMYVAQFTMDGISFQIVADEMTLEDVVKVAASIICPDQEIVITP